MPEVSRSIGIQVALCNCSFGRIENSTVALLEAPEDSMTSSLRRDPESAPLCDSERMSTSSGDPGVSSEDVVDRCTRAESLELEETRRSLLRDDEDGKRKSQSSSRPGSTSSPTYPSGLSHEMKRQSSATRTSSNDSMSNVKRDSASSHHSYHFRRKLANFRSDSVFSDVMPTSSSSCQQDPRKGSDPLEKSGGGSGSLSSLKQKESKWISLRKKLKINSSTTGSISKKQQQSAEKSDETVPPLKPVSAKRSLFQRAKTLAILPVAKVKGDSTEDPPRAERHRHRKNQHAIQQPKELFNVGGEMNMIPLEFLIDINDLNLDAK